MSNIMQLSIPGMKCGGCVSAVEGAIKDQPGVTGFKVDLESKTAEIEGDVEFAVVGEAIRAAGFEATLASAEQA